MEKHFVRYFSPGTLVAETTDKPIDSWDVDKAVEMVKDIKERYGATPYGFRFITRSRTNEDLDSKETKRSNLYYLGGKILTLTQVKKEMPNEHILISNMEINKYKRIIINRNSYQWTQPLRKGDVVLPFRHVSARLDNGKHE